MQNEEISQKPRSQTCPICGESYGLTSQKFHYKWCLKKWVEQNSENEQQVGKGPILPSSQNYVLEVSEQSKKEADIFNNIAYACSLSQPKADKDYFYNTQRKRYRNKDVKDKNQASSNKSSGQKESMSKNQSNKSSSSNFQPHFVIQGVNPNFTSAQTVKSQQQNNNNLVTQDTLQNYRLENYSEEDQKAQESINDQICPEIFKDLEDNKLKLNMEYYLSFDKNAEQRKSAQVIEENQEKSFSPIKKSFTDQEGNLCLFRPNFGACQNAEVLVRKVKPNFQRDEYHKEPVSILLSDNIDKNYRNSPLKKRSLKPLNEGGISIKTQNNQYTSVRGRPLESEVIVNYNYDCKNVYNSGAY